MSTTNLKNRIVWVDILKFIGIFAIVLGHTFSAGDVKRYLYSFHVPLFFFLQGVVCNVKDKKFLTYVKERFIRIMVPFFVFSFISLFIILICGNIIGGPFLEESPGLKKGIIEIFKGYCSVNRPLWFLPCTFLVSVITFLIIKLTNKCKLARTKHFIILTVILASMIWQFLNDSFFNISGLPWKLETALNMLSFFFIGFLIRPVIEKTEKRILTFIAAVVLIVIGAILGLINGEAGYLGNYYGNIFIYYTAALSTIFGLCFACIFIPAKNNVVSYIGTNTLVILLMHKFPIVFFQFLIPVTKRYMAENNVFAGIIVSIISIAITLVAGEIIAKFLPVIIGKKSKKKTS